MDVITPASYVFWSSLAMLLTGVVTFIGCSYLAAPYGRYSTTSSKEWGILLPAQIAWMIMESPNLWIVLLVYFFRESLGSGSDSVPVIDNSPVNKLLLFCFFLHYTNRSIIYPLRMQGSKCSPMPISVMGAAFIFCAWNGTHQALSLILVHSNKNVQWTDVHLILGVATFFLGLAINIHSDSILISQRSASSSKSKAESSAGSKYVIPVGGMFEYVSCANYFGEIVEWWGFALACGGTLPAVAFAFYTMAYLTSRAIHYHKWYLDKFDDYPKSRKALIPFLM